jgi:L-alanine-DL-glutamate epimerase-like enolase superfamily enzyme
VGLFTLFAGIHQALSAPNAVYQETVRANPRTFYRDLVTESISIEDGHILAPPGPGLEPRSCPTRPPDRA